MCLHVYLVCYRLSRHARASRAMQTTRAIVAAAVQCKALDIAHGTAHCSDGVAANSTCIVVCDSGFHNTGSDHLSCSVGGEWNASATCVASECPPLSTPAHGSLACTNGFNVSSVCTAACSPGYRVNGTAARTCAASGVWSGSAASCVLGMGVLLSSWLIPLALLS